MAEKTTITKLPAGKEPKEDINGLKARIAELEKDVAAHRSRLDDLSKAKKTVIVKKTTEYVGLGAEKPEPPPKPPTPPPPQVVLRDTGVKDEYIKELEKINKQLSNEYKDLQSKVTMIKAKQVIKTEEEESNESLRAKIKESKDLMEALKIENDLTKKTLALMSM